VRSAPIRFRSIGVGDEWSNDELASATGLFTERARRLRERRTPRCRQPRRFRVGRRRVNS
jgi:hypothetical protein